MSAVGRTLDVEVGPVAHGGHCVARHDGRVLFVRHALPGERVRVVVTDGHDGSAYWRADAVEVVEPSPDRVEPPCPWAGPGRCGGCDWQHASLPAQRALKAAVVNEQLGRLAGLDLSVEVEEVPGDAQGLGWRTRVQFAVDDDGTPGLRRHRSHEVVPVDRCRIAHPLVEEADVTGRRWPGHASVEVAVSPSTGERLVLPDGRGRESLTEVVGERAFRVTGGGFWQVHPGAAATLLAAVLDGLGPQPGESALDLYCGVGLFAAELAARVGPTGRVTAVETDRVAVEDARHNLAGLAGVRIERGRVDHVLRRLRLGRADLVVLDPPRSGAGRAVVDLLSRVRARRIAYVACDPAALARDLRYFAERGYQVSGLRAFDLFPMTAHVECVAVLEPRGA
jgi:tRNA/tmRNA/rRNA uracil-C5-methylase (TrmA/RlmC/RlmD family)